MHAEFAFKQLQKRENIMMVIDSTLVILPR